MARAEIPVDLRNPGQVFACLGFLEAADVLLGDARGGFAWDGPERFILETNGERNPVEVVLEFLAAAKVRRMVPWGWVEPPKKKKDSKESSEEQEEDVDESYVSSTFPAREGDRMALPILLGGGNLPELNLGHWADGSGRESFKLYAGNRSAAKIATDMLRMIAELWERCRDKLLEAPLDVDCPMAGSFNFDPRGAWTAIDAGYSPDKHKIKGMNVFASPVVEFMAAWGLEHARPQEYKTREIRYQVWNELLFPILARTVLAGNLGTIPGRQFTFTLALSGKNKVICFAQEDSVDA